MDSFSFVDNFRPNTKFELSLKLSKVMLDDLLQVLTSDSLGNALYIYVQFFSLQRFLNKWVLTIISTSLSHAQHHIP
jgi:hypothetical protein